MQRTGIIFRRHSRAGLLLARLLPAFLAMMFILVFPLAAYGGGNGEGAATPTPGDSLAFEDQGIAIGEQISASYGLGAVAKPLAAITTTVPMSGEISAPTSVDLVLFGEEPDITNSWWWVSWPWLMVLITAFSLVGVLLVRRSWAAERR